ncbi:DUF3862 domain-containing protein [Thermodesulfobacteriota bacterium]
MKSLKKLIAMAILLSLVFFGCGKLNRENYDKIKPGMDYQLVVDIIGDPDECDAVMGAKNCVWGDENKNITIKFIADKVIVSSMKGL